MTKLPKILLMLSVAGFALGLYVTFSGTPLDPAWGVALPTGAICFGLFLIALMLQNEAALFDQEQHLRLASAPNPHPGDQPNKSRLTPAASSAPRSGPAMGTHA